jgi:LuxR family transcriptional regulator, maltose regulon positive regulatory protein
MSEPQFLNTKVIVPPVRTALIPRAHLIKRLCTSAPLVLLSASAGFGKTTLLCAWARETHSHVAWVTLDEQDNDPTHFWTYILLALRSCLDLSFGETAFAQLGATPLPLLSTILTSLLNDLARHGEEVALVLDDYHLIEEPAIHQSLGFWLAHTPACLHLLLASRVDPDLPLSRLRARGQLVEIRDADLRLSTLETATFLTQTMELPLGDEDVLQLWQRTEGWLVGLQLAALALRTQTDLGAAVQAFSGSHRFLLDYLQEEILGREPLSTQRFLLQTAILTSLQADLCQALTGEHASQHMLEGLERANLFVVPLDAERRCYRLHPLIRSALLARFQASEPEQVLVLHKRAAVWYEQQHLLPEAISHALAASDVIYAADLIERFLVPQSWRNEYHTLRRWLSQLPQEVLRNRPRLAFLAAQVTILTTPSGPRAWQLAQEPLNFAEQGYREAGNLTALGAVLVVRAVVTAFQGNFLCAFVLARHALTLLPPEDRQWRGLGLCVLGTEAVLSGQNDTAVPLLQQALALCDAVGSLTGSQFATLMLGEVSLAAGDLQQADAFFRRVLCISIEEPDLTRLLLTDDVGGRRGHFEQLAWYSLAYLAYVRNDLVEAQYALQESLEQGIPALFHILTPGLLLQVRLLYAQGETKQVQTFLADLAVKASQPEAQQEIRFCQAWLALKRGDLAEAQRWAEGLAQGSTPLACVRREEEALLLACLRRQEGYPGMALGLLVPMLQEARAQARLHSELQILVLSALVEATGGDLEQACKTLLQLVTTTWPSGYFSLFLEEGPPMKTLLEMLVPDVQEQALASYVHRLLQAFGSTSVDPKAHVEQKPSPLLEPLTPQEQRVLTLLGEGASNQEIANALVLSERTARKHVSNVLGKLGAKNRTQAIAHAREDGLL